MPDLSKPPSIDDDGGWIDADDEHECSECGEPLNEKELEAWNEYRIEVCAKCAGDDCDDEC